MAECLASIFDEMSCISDVYHKSRCKFYSECPVLTDRSPCSQVISTQRAVNVNKCRWAVSTTHVDAVTMLINPYFRNAIYAHLKTVTACNACLTCLYFIFCFVDEQIHVYYLGFVFIEEQLLTRLFESRRDCHFAMFVVHRRKVFYWINTISPVLH